MHFCLSNVRLPAGCQQFASLLHYCRWRQHLQSLCLRLLIYIILIFQPKIPKAQSFPFWASGCFWPWLTAADWQGWCFRRLGAWSTVFHLQPLKTWLLVLWTLRWSDSLDLNNQMISKWSFQLLQSNKSLVETWQWGCGYSIHLSKVLGMLGHSFKGRH